MSTLELEHIKHTSSSSNNLSTHSDGSLTLGSLNGNIHVGTMGVGHTASPTSYGDANTMFSIHKNTTNGSVNALIGTDTVKGGMYVNNTGSDNEIKFGTTSNYPTKVMANGVTGVEVDGSGRIAMPAQPSFFFRNTNTNTNNSQVILFDQQYHNNGSHYSTSTGRFTVPIAGYYFFYATVCWNRTTGTGDHYCDIRHNANVAVRMYTDKSGSANVHPQISGCYSNYMAANDYIDIYAVSGGAIINNGNHCNFGGYKYA